jgi:diacylglycerol kinase (ATP)
MASKKKVKVEISRGKYVESLNLKKLGIKRIFKSFKFSFDGLKYAYTHEQSLALHVIVMAVIIACGFGFHISPMQWVITLVMGALILVAELFNTSIEAVVDMVTEEYHPLAKVAKDTASAACFVADLIAAGMWLVVFAPKIIALF